MRRARGRGGFTLLEILIAVTLVGLLSVGMLYAMRVGFDALGRTDNRLMANRRVLGAQRILDGEIAGLIPVVTSCGGARRIFFAGGPAGMTFVSSYSLQEAARGYARVLEYSVIPGEGGRGVRLTVTENPYTGGSSSQICGGAAGQNGASPGAFVLADKLASCSLRYLLHTPNGDVWADSFSGVTPPGAIHIEMTPLEPDPARLQMASMTVVVHAGRDPQQIYEDVEPVQIPQ